ncbi:hypothetical protein ABI59_22205 [Acidobacteria bacterium Mor1]|nr:hypothetical protein ABI59_22205 [Acidobacteria bacterium Mor1]
MNLGGEPPIVLYSRQWEENPAKRLRVIDPLERLAASGALEIHPMEEVFRPDSGFERRRVSALFLYVLDFNAGSPEVARGLRWALRHGRAVLCDTDDQYLIPHGASPFDGPLDPHLPYFEELLKAAHAVTVTGDALKEEMQALNDRVVVIPNTVTPAHYVARPAGAGSAPKAGESLRVGWCGGPTHLDDLCLMLPAVAELQARHDFELVLFGMFDEEMSTLVERTRELGAVGGVSTGAESSGWIDAFRRLSRALEGVRYRHVPSVPYREFPAALASLELDIGLCPLHDTRFNRCKSAVKFYQYAAAGAVTLASDVEPYTHEPCCRTVNTVESWSMALGRLLEDEGFREACRTQQRKWVSENRTLERVGPLYEELLTQLPARVRAAFRAARSG